MKKGTNIILWIASIILMLFVVIYQKVTGPTYPYKGEKEIYGQAIDYSLPRSNDGTYTVQVKIYDETGKLEGFANFRRYKSYDEWTKIPLQRNGAELSFEIPHQPAAGKVMYHIYLKENDKKFIPLTEDAIILRFRDPVPMWVIVFHLIFIFATISMAIRTGFEALFNGSKVKIMTILTIIFLILGGFIFGPLMQKYAFGEFWTGFPFGYDLTDNKTLIGFIFWMIALWASYKVPRKKIWHIIATIVLIGTYFIPHSLLGSELDYTKIDPKSIEKNINE